MTTPRETVTRYLESLFVLVDELVEVTTTALSGPDPRLADVDLETECTELLDRSPAPLAGAGLVVEPGVLADAEYWLEWWQPVPGAAPGRYRRLAVEITPGVTGFRDYTQLDWFTDPRATGDRAITGPYVDYLCTDQYSLTLTAPVTVDGHFVGVAGLDVLARTVEQHLLDELDPGSRVAVVNAQGRVVTSFVPELVTGDLVHGLPEPPGWTADACADLPFVVLERP